MNSNSLRMNALANSAGASLNSDSLAKLELESTGSGDESSRSPPKQLKITRTVSQGRKLKSHSISSAASDSGVSDSGISKPRPRVLSVVSQRPQVDKPREVLKRTPHSTSVTFSDPQMIQSQLLKAMEEVGATVTPKNTFRYGCHLDGKQFEAEVVSLRLSTGSCFVLLTHLEGFTQEAGKKILEILMKHVG